MKTATLIGIGSLTLNAALLGLFAVGLSTSSDSARVDVKPTAVPENNETVRSPEAWTEIDSTDLVGKRDRLAAEGFPPSAIRAILAAQIRERFATRRKAIEAASASLPFWKQGIDPRMQAELRAISREEQRELTTLLGPDPTSGPAARLSRQFPELSPDKINQLTAIRERYDEQRQSVYAGFRGPSTPVERERMNALDKAMNAEFATVLTPTEWENYSLRMSNTANNMRYSLSTFEPSESEFRAIYKLQSVFDEQFAMAGQASQDQMRFRSEAQKQLQTELAAALGPERYRDYQRASDYNYQQTSRVVARLGLPAETATALYTIQKDLEERRNDFYRGGQANPAAAAERLGLLQQEGNSRVAAVLGGNPTAIAAYKEYGGSWLSNFVPRSPAPPAKK